MYNRQYNKLKYTFSWSTTF